MIARRRRPSSLGLLILCVGFIGAAGCSSTVTQDYGTSEGLSARSSPGGLSIFREMVETRRMKTYTVRSLSPANMMRLNTIVWCPDHFATHDKETYVWLQTWMSQGEKTLVYIGRDFSPHAAYWQAVAEQTSGDSAKVADHDIARDQAAYEQSLVDGKRRSVRSRLLMPWCKWDLSWSSDKKIEDFSGPWAKSLETSESRIVLRSGPEPLRVAELNTLKTEMDWESQLPLATPQGVGYEKQWMPNDSSLRDVANRLDASQLPRWTTLLASSDQVPILSLANAGSVADSRVLSISNHSLLCNFSMISPMHRGLALQVIDQFASGGVGFISGERDPLIRDDQGEDQQRGFEMLTVWPLNVVTIHAAFLGIAIIIAAFPIFGRPKRLPGSSTSDFGMHIDAVGEMMQRSGDSVFAIQMIAEYFRSVRGDHASPWSTLDQKSTPDRSPFKEPPIQPTIQPTITSPLEPTSEGE